MAGQTKDLIRFTRFKLASKREGTLRVANAARKTKRQLATRSHRNSRKEEQ